MEQAARHHLGLFRARNRPRCHNSAGYSLIRLLHARSSSTASHHLIKIVTMLTERGIGLKVLTGQGAGIDTTTAAGRMSFGIFVALAGFESELIH